MAWMETRADARADPGRLWPEVRSIVMLAMSYAPDHDPIARLGVADHGLVSVYAQGVDYHDVIKPRLKALARWLIAAAGGDARVFVDTAPVMEKTLAEAAGLGWQGKHTVLVGRDLGSWSFLGALFTTVALAPDTPGRDRCGSCSRCLSICPTDAFPAPGRLDSNRCISYLTIEHKGPIDRALRTRMGNRIYGCDDCVAVCPWNKFAAAAREARLSARRDVGLRPLSELLALDDAGFRALFARTPVKRTGRARFLRNVLIAAGNSGEPALCDAVVRLLDDGDALVRGAAVWALARLDRTRLDAEAHRARAEDDDGVRAEWRAEGVA